MPIFFYKSGLTIDRINVNDNYSPSNCRWVTRKEQANNRRNTVYVTIDGITKTLTEWAEFAGLNKSTLKNRYCDGVRGVMLLHKSENTKFKKGYNKYDNPRHYKDYKPPTIIEAENSSAIDDDVKKYCDYLKSETYDFCNRIENGEVNEG